MGYYDRAIDASFKKRDDGKLVYYPYAYFGPKYILSKDSETRIRKFLNIYYLFATVIPILLVIR